MEQPIKNPILKPSNYEKQRICCNPLSDPNHTTAKITVNDINDDHVAKFIAIDVHWVTKKMKVCKACIDKVNKQYTERMASAPHATELTPPGLIESTNEESDLSQPSLPSSNESGRMAEKVEQIQKLAKILNISLTEKASRIHPGSSNYRGTSSEETLKNILTEVKKLFPTDIVKKVDLFEEVYGKLKTEYGATENEEVQRTLLRCVPASISRQKLMNDFEASERDVRR